MTDEIVEGDDVIALDLSRWREVQLDAQDTRRASVDAGQHPQFCLGDHVVVLSFLVA